MTTIDASRLFQRFLDNAQARGFDPKAPIMEVFALFAEALELELEDKAAKRARSGTIHDSTIRPVPIPTP